MKKVSFYFMGLLLVLIGCSDRDDEIVAKQTVCDSANTEFMQLYNQIATNPLSDEQTTIDTEVHGYKFKVTSQKTICSVGYQSNHVDATMPYTIEITNDDSNTIVYSDSHVFSHTTMSYVSLSSTVTLQPNVSYTIKRIQTDWSGNAFNVCGKVMYLSDGNFGYANFLPLSSTDLTITSSVFYTGSPDPSWPTNNFVLPCLDIVFEH